MTRSASRGSSRTCVAAPPPWSTTPTYPSSSAARNSATAASNAAGLSLVHCARVEWPVPSILMRRDIPVSSCRRCLGRILVEAASSEAEALANQALHLATVGAALRLAHHRADDRADRLLLAALQLRHRTFVRGDRAVDDPAELVGAREGERALGHDRVGVAAFGREHVEDLLRRRLRDRPRTHEFDQSRESLRAHT